ncbi:hypothetical protein GXW82_03375 [Streptacidiphilus sp. 4-A2]|nr:hypothetical protein [Streptacidiphilus sp. 4-A2]
MLTALARAHVRGVDVDWSRVLPAGNRVDLPTYAFTGQRFWPLGPHKLRLGAPAADAGQGSDAAEAGFWAAVEAGDRSALSQTLAVDDQGLGDLLRCSPPGAAASVTARPPTTGATGSPGRRSPTLDRPRCPAPGSWSPARRVKAAERCVRRWPAMARRCRSPGWARSR